MEQKLVRVPFDVELAKKIMNKEIEGRIFDNLYKCPARIVDFNFQTCKGKLNVVISEVGKGKEVFVACNNEGIAYSETVDKFDKEPIFMLEIPEYLTFKDGDILISKRGNPFIYNGKICSDGTFGTYCGIDINGEIVFDSEGWTCVVKGYANKSQKKNLIGLLKRNRAPKAKEYLKRFFGIEEKPKYEFKPFDKVLVRDDDSVWFAGIFSHLRKDGKFLCVGASSWEQCLPYNEQTAHLLGTTDDWEE